MYWPRGKKMKWKIQRSTINTRPKGVKHTKLTGFKHVTSTNIKCNIYLNRKWCEASAMQKKSIQPIQKSDIDRIAHRPNCKKGTSECWFSIISVSLYRLSSDWRKICQSLGCTNFSFPFFAYEFSHSRRITRVNQCLFILYVNCSIGCRIDSSSSSAHNTLKKNHNKLNKFGWLMDLCRCCCLLSGFFLDFLSFP